MPNFNAVLSMYDRKVRVLSDVRFDVDADNIEAATTFVTMLIGNNGYLIRKMQVSIAPEEIDIEDWHEPI